MITVNESDKITITNLDSTTNNGLKNGGCSYCSFC